MSHSRILADLPVVYPIQRLEIKCFSISQGQYNFSADNFFNAVPNILYVGLVSSAFDVDGKSIPSKPFQPNFESGSYLDVYSAFVEGGSCLISREDFSKGNCIFTFKTKYESQGLQPMSERGQMRLDLTCSSPLPESVTVICYGTFSSVLTIDNTRNIQML